MRCAIDRLESKKNLLDGMGRLGLVINQASTTSNFISAAEAIYQTAKVLKNVKVTAIFAPQHGYQQTEQDNMQETSDAMFSFSDGYSVPLLSLYSSIREPSAEQLDLIDTLIVDLQDIGCRVYTYMLTLAGCLRSAAKSEKKVVVFDRINPIGLCYFDKPQKKWMRVEGNQFETKWNSFVGWYDIPMRHGLSLGELGRYFIQTDKLDVDYEVIKVEGSKRSASIEENMSAPWVMPSPNIPTWQSAFFFPAFVALEGTNVSEGRGTTVPFQLIGSPWLDNKKCIEFLNQNIKLFSSHASHKPAPITFRAHDFRPTFNKYTGQVCHGIYFHVENTVGINLFALGMCFIYFCCKFQGDKFQWTKQAYEYNFKDLPINLILGNTKLVELLEQTRSLNQPQLITGTQTEPQINTQVNLINLQLNIQTRSATQTDFNSDEEFYKLLEDSRVQSENFIENISSYLIYQD